MIKSHILVDEPLKVFIKWPTLISTVSFSSGILSASLPVIVQSVVPPLQSPTAFLEVNFACDKMFNATKWSEINMYLFRWFIITFQRYVQIVIFQTHLKLFLHKILMNI